MRPYTKTPFFASSLIWWMRLSAESWIREGLPGRRSVHCRSQYRRRSCFAAVTDPIPFHSQKDPKAVSVGLLWCRNKDPFQDRWHFPRQKMSFLLLSVRKQKCSNCIPVWVHVNFKCILDAFLCDHAVDVQLGGCFCCDVIEHEDLSSIGGLDDQLVFVLRWKVDAFRVFWVGLLGLESHEHFDLLFTVYTATGLH